jgi:hypothetical protein
MEPVNRIAGFPSSLNRCSYTDTNVWLHEQKIEGGLQIQAHCFGRCRSIDGPPLNNTFNLACRAPRDKKFKRHP